MITNDPFLIEQMQWISKNNAYLHTSWWIACSNFPLLRIALILPLLLLAQYGWTISALESQTSDLKQSLTNAGLSVKMLLLTVFVYVQIWKVSLSLHCPVWNMFIFICVEHHLIPCSLQDISSHSKIVNIDHYLDFCLRILPLKCILSSLARTKLVSKGWSNKAKINDIIN